MLRTVSNLLPLPRHLAVRISFSNYPLICTQYNAAPVPYVGQGAQQGLEDAGTLALLLKELKCFHAGTLDTSKTEIVLPNLRKALIIYQKLRIPHTKRVLEASKALGHLNQRRAESEKICEVEEELLQRKVFFHENLPDMFPGATHDYRLTVEAMLKQEANMLPALDDEMS